MQSKKIVLAVAFLAMAPLAVFLGYKAITYNKQAHDVKPSADITTVEPVEQPVEKQTKKEKTGAGEAAAQLTPAPVTVDEKPKQKIELPPVSVPSKKDKRPPVEKITPPAAVHFKTDDNSEEPLTPPTFVPFTPQFDSEEPVILPVYDLHKATPEKKRTIVLQPTSIFCENEDNNIPIITSLAADPVAVYKEPAEEYKIPPANNLYNTHIRNNSREQITRPTGIHLETDDNSDDKEGASMSGVFTTSKPINTNEGEIDDLPGITVKRAEILLADPVQMLTILKFISFSLYVGDGQHPTALSETNEPLFSFFHKLTQVDEINPLKEMKVFEGLVSYEKTISSLLENIFEKLKDESKTKVERFSHKYKFDNLPQAPDNISYFVNLDNVSILCQSARRVFLKDLIGRSLTKENEDKNQHLKKASGKTGYCHTMIKLNSSLIVKADGYLAQNQRIVDFIDKESYTNDYNNKNTRITYELMAMLVKVKDENNEIKFKFLYSHSPQGMESNCSKNEWSEHKKNAILVYYKTPNEP
ncbi:hypothetical protein ENBRE01_2865 [Enteropsectra breve]|nr:hypothetical protein ENBRE01_2865 [Enteropsectra breve]